MGRFEWSCASRQSCDVEEEVKGKDKQKKQEKQEKELTSVAVAVDMYHREAL